MCYISIVAIALHHLEMMIMNVVTDNGAVISALNMRVEKLESTLIAVRKDLLLRADKDSGGCLVVNIGNSIWRSLNSVLTDCDLANSELKKLLDDMPPTIDLDYDAELEAEIDALLGVGVNIMTDEDDQELDDEDEDLDVEHDECEDYDHDQNPINNDPELEKYLLLDEATHLVK